MRPVDLSDRDAHLYAITGDRKYKKSYRWETIDKAPKGVKLMLFFPGVPGKSPDISRVDILPITPSRKPDNPSHWLATTEKAIE